MFIYIMFIQYDKMFIYIMFIQYDKKNTSEKVTYWKLFIK